MESIFQLNKMGVFGIVDEGNKTIFLASSSNMLGALNRILDKNINITSSSKLITCEIVTDRLELTMRYNYWHRFYSNMGFIVTSKKPSPYKVRIDPIVSEDKGRNEHMLFHVNLIHRGSKALLVGIFKSYPGAEGFVAQNYSNGVYNLVTQGIVNG